LQLKNRIKDIYILASFTIIIGLVSLIWMDLIIFPLSLFALKNKIIFNQIIKYGSLFIFFLIIFSFIFRKISNLKLEKPTSNLFTFIFFRPIQYLILSFFFILITVLIILVLYFLLTYNNYIFYRFTNIL